MIIQIAASLENITTLVRPNYDGVATIWDGNRFIQCRTMPNQIFRCESAGTVMQPSLMTVLTPARIERLATLGWEIDSSFGNWVHVFPSDQKLQDVADLLLKALIQGYDAKIDTIEIKTDWVYHQICMPRVGPRQNLAGSIVTSASMMPTAIRGCNYVKPVTVSSFQDLKKLYEKQVIGESQRLRININRAIHFVISTDFGYVQCTTNIKPDAIFCEAASAFSWAALESILTPQRINHLHELGFSDPGTSPNYSKIYLLEKYSDTDIAHELLTIIYEIYGYHGTSSLQITTE